MAKLAAYIHLWDARVQAGFYAKALGGEIVFALELQP
jgi:hypothetical protein